MIWYRTVPYRSVSGTRPDTDFEFLAKYRSDIPKVDQDHCPYYFRGKWKFRITFPLKLSAADFLGTDVTATLIQQAIVSNRKQT